MTWELSYYVHFVINCVDDKVIKYRYKNDIIISWYNDFSTPDIVMGTSVEKCCVLSAT